MRLTCVVLATVARLRSQLRAPRFHCAKVTPQYGACNLIPFKPDRLCQVHEG